MLYRNRYDGTGLPQPNEEAVPSDVWETACDLFDTWHHVVKRNRRLTRYYEMKNPIKDLGIAIPPQLARVEEVVGWAAKAVDVRVNRSRFDGFVFRGESDPTLDALVTANRMRQLVRQVTRSMLTHGCAAMAVMRGTGMQPAAKVRAYSANQCCMLWDKDADGISAGIVLASVDSFGVASRYVMHLPARKQLTEAGLVIGGLSPDERLVEMVELPEDVHPWFVASQAHPEFKSRPTNPAPLFREFVRASIARHDGCARRDISPALDA